MENGSGRLSSDRCVHLPMVHGWIWSGSGSFSIIVYNNTFNLGDTHHSGIYRCGDIDNIVFRMGVWCACIFRHFIHRWSCIQALNGGPPAEDKPK